jgi:YfiH family protein
LAEEIEVLSADALAGVPHGFLGRRGGISIGEVAGLNVGLGAGDDDAAVSENRRRAVTAVLPGAELATVYQVHSPDCVVVTEPWPLNQRPHADAMVTDRPGVLLGIVTADCVPVLFADPVAGVVGAAHAGWKGALGGVLENTIAALASLGCDPASVCAAIGPCIAQASYEVSGSFRDSFPDAAECFAPGRDGHWQFDLELYVENRLKRAGIGAISRLSQDTYAQEDRFFSFRRATHLGQANYGRQISLIGLCPPA